MKTRKPVVLSYGGGTNSTALAIGKAERGEPIDLILFADTGGERPDTYRYVEKFSEWLEARQYPAIKVVVYKRGDERLTLEDDCLERGALPSKAYGFPKCSEKHKVRPQERFLRTWQPAVDAWAAGGTITQLVGFDAGEPGRAARPNPKPKKYDRQFPLIEWNWGREECAAAIERAGLPQPGKSSCFYCPSMRPREIITLGKCYPDLLDRALAMEAKAQPGLRGVMKGLGRDWSWADVVKADRNQLKMFRQPMEDACACYDGWDGDS